MKNYVCVTKCCSKLIYQTLPDKQVVYVLPSMHLNPGKAASGPGWRYRDHSVQV